MKKRIKLFVVMFILFLALFDSRIVEAIREDHTSVSLHRRFLRIVYSVKYKIRKNSSVVDMKTHVTILHAGSDRYLIYQNFEKQNVWVRPFGCSPYAFEIEYVKVKK